MIVISQRAETFIIYRFRLVFCIIYVGNPL